MKKSMAPPRMKLGEILLIKGILTADQLYDLLQMQKQTRQTLGNLLIEKGHISEDELYQLLSEQLGVPHIWLRKGMVDPRIVHVLPREKALQFKVIPMFKVNNVLTLGTSDPHNFFNLDKVAEITKLEIQLVLCRAEDIVKAIHECYQQEVHIDEVMSSVDEDAISVMGGTPEACLSEIAQMAEGSPVINLTNKILLKSIRQGASDIHLEPQRSVFRVRVRIDGVLYELMSMGLERHPAVVSRLKVMANLDISERRIPQDGRSQVMVDGRVVDLRFSSMPGIHGEKVVLRILDRSKSILDINKLGFEPALLQRFKAMVRRSFGLIIVCGPTGSGKTTTLYSAINMLNTVEKNIIAIEDPVEYQLTGINQNQVKEEIGLTFAKILKHTLRQDPDIILVGEIRDRETAEIAIQASLTGHLVLSTLHTNDSPSAITRLLEMGIEPYLISSALVGTIGQRLLRSICPHCKTGYYPPKEVLRELGLDGGRQVRFSRGKGCSACFDSGFKGRVGIHELLENHEDLQNLILSSPTIEKLQGYLRESGCDTLKDSGYKKVVSGVTTLEEVQRVTSVEM